MEKNKKISTITYIIVFAVFVLALSVLSGAKFIYNEVRHVNVNMDLDGANGFVFESKQAADFWGKIHFINLNGAINRMIGKREMNNVVRLENGFLAQTMGPSSDSALLEYASKVVSLNEYLEGKNISCVYVSTPYSISKYDDELPYGIEDYSNENVDKFLYILNEYQVDTIDMREEMNADDISVYSMRYVTDHHWTTEAGIYAYGKIEDYLTDELQCEVDPKIRDISNYDINYHYNWYLGSYGQRTGRYFGGMDDFSPITPKFDTSITDLSTGQSGTMAELMIDGWSFTRRSYADRYAYDWVLSTVGDFKNNESINDKKILVIGDSYSRTVMQYIAMGFSEVHYISNNESSRVTKEYIEEYNPDAVILMYYPFMLADGSSAFNFDIAN